MNIDQRGKAASSALKTAVGALPTTARDLRNLLDAMRNSITQGLAELATRQDKLRQAETKVATLNAVLIDLELALAATKQQPDKPGDCDSRLVDKRNALIQGIKETKTGWPSVTVAGVVSTTYVAAVYRPHGVLPGEYGYLDRAELLLQGCLAKVQESLEHVEQEIAGARKAARKIREAATDEREVVLAERLNEIAERLEGIVDPLVVEDEQDAVEAAA